MDVGERAQRRDPPHGARLRANPRSGDGCIRKEVASGQAMTRGRPRAHRGERGRVPGMRWRLHAPSGQNDMLRPDLNALTEAQWEYYFKVGQQSDTQLVSQLVEHESEKPTRAFHIWVMAIAVGFGMAIGAIVAWPSVRRTMRTLMVPVQMEDLNVTIGAYAGYGDGRP
jgi:hypothetical protein